VRFFALLSVLVIFIESGAGTQYHLTFDEWHILSGWSWR
jgi:voltage-gated potassium channel